MKNNKKTRVFNFIVTPEVELNIYSNNLDDAINILVSLLGKQLYYDIISNNDYLFLHVSEPKS